MNTEMGWVTVALGLALRIGVPLLALAGMVWVMRRLDARWQAQARAPQATAEPPALHCWEVHACPPEQRATCAVPQHPETPCWQQHRDGDGNLPERCLACELFATVPVAQTKTHETHHA